MAKWSPAEVKEYLAKFDVKKHLEAAINDSVTNQADDPLMHVADYLFSLRPEHSPYAPVRAPAPSGPSAAGTSGPTAAGTSGPSGPTDEAAWYFGNSTNDGFVCSLSAEQKAALKATADAMSAPGKGFLAADESAGPWLRAGHVEAKEIPDTEPNRAAYRSMLFNTPGLNEYISGVILHVETLFQKDASGEQMVDIITKNGMIPGIKLDKGYDKEGICGTAMGPLGHPETWCKGIDDLGKRAKAAYDQGARFAKWRNVLQIDPACGLPSDLAIDMCVQNLAQYAAICQREGLVPIVEPEIVPNGSHGIEVCLGVTEKVLKAQFAALKMHGVYLEGAVLKPNMVKSGLTGPKATSVQVATATINTLLKCVPPAMPGIFFLSGETALDEDNEETATNNLNMMHKLFPKLPWSVSFSYGKALQKTCIVTWMGKAENNGAAQTALLNRSKANSDAWKGKYVAGTCASVGVDGNVQMAGGAY